MKNIRTLHTLLLNALLLLSPVIALAQVQITFPISRMVFQRNNANEATIRIGGFYRTAINRVEAKAIPIDGGQETPWITIQSNPQGGAFSGNLTLKGGWYRIQVRGFQGEQQISSAELDRVGVGEVFVVAGQSNAQGFFGYGGPGGGDRVNIVNFGINIEPAYDPPFPSFSKLDSDNRIFPRGESSWAWGRLGDLLVQRFGVPVLFFNAGWAGTSSLNWRVSAEGGQAIEEYTGTVPYPPGQPYGNLKVALHYYVHTLGIRAILWQQGEADNFFNRGTDDYANNLSRVIQKSREHSGKNISWVVARSSYDDSRGSSASVINGQNKVIQTMGNVFEGPNADAIQIPRQWDGPQGPDNVHFHGDGLVQLAQAWNNSLNDNFFRNSAPQEPTVGPNLSVACAGTNTLALRVEGGFAAINWNSGQNSQTLTTGAGRYMATVKDGAGNTLFTQAYEVPSRPSITSNGPTTFCEGGNVTLTSSYDNTTWNSNIGGKSVTVGTVGTYVARFRDSNECDFVSDPVNVVVNPLPAPPTARALSATRFCDRNSTTLESTDGTVYNWSTGDRTKQIEVRRGGDYSLTITDQNGCTSRESNKIQVIVDPIPNRPTVVASGPTTFCADQTVTLTSTAEESYVWTSGQTSRNLVVNQSGDYSVRTRNTFGCLSDPSNGIGIKVNPLPAPPILSANGPTIFCDGDRVTLTANSLFPTIWSTQETTSSITVTKTGGYSARVRDGNGCLSPVSQVITVDAKPVPSVPTVRQIGTYTLEADGARSGDYYEWQRDNTITPLRTPIVKATQSGVYQAKAFLVYDNNLVCSSDFSTPIAYTLIIDNDGLSIYPNPSLDKRLMLETLENIADATVTVYTLSGQEVMRGTVGIFDRRQTWDLSTLPSGHYILHVRSGSFSASKRLLIGL